MNPWFLVLWIAGHPLQAKVPTQSECLARLTEVKRAAPKAKAYCFPSTERY